MTAIPFTQFLMPDGRPRNVTIHRPAEIAAKAEQIIRAGYRLECEIIQTGEVSFTIMDDEQDHAIEIALNGPEVPAAVDRLILGFVPILHMEPDPEHEAYLDDIEAGEAQEAQDELRRPPL